MADGHYAIYKLKANGDFDSNYKISTGEGGINDLFIDNINQSIYACGANRHGAILVASDFYGNERRTFGPRKLLYTLKPQAIVANTSYAYLLADAKLFKISIDSAQILPFDPNSGFNNEVFDIKCLKDGSILAGGVFDECDKTATKKLVKFDANGLLQNSFVPALETDQLVNCLDWQAEGKILVGGYRGSVNYPIQFLKKLEADGSVDPTFKPYYGFDGALRDVITQKNGDVIIVGFARAKTSSPYLAFISRLSSDGKVDNSFKEPFLLGIVQCVKEVGGKYLIGGRFYNSEGISNLLRLNNDGSVDATFKANIPNGKVNAIEIDSAGNLYVGGSFASANGIETPAFAIFNKNGEIIPVIKGRAVFKQGSAVVAIKLLTNNKIGIGGNNFHYCPRRPKQFGNIE